MAEPNGDRPTRSEKRMSDAEALMWMAERDPLLRSAFQTVTLLDDVPSLERFRRRMITASRRIPRLRQVVAAPPAGIGAPLWAEDPDFDIDFHVRRVALPPPGDDAQLLELAALHLQDPFDPGRPLWQFTLVVGIQGGRAALLAKMHHTISDGVGAVRLSAQFIDLERVPAPDADLPVDGDDEDDTSAEDEPGVAATVLGAIGDRARVPLDLGRWAVSGVFERITHPLQVPRETAEALEAAQATLRQMLVTEPARSPLWAGRRSRRRRLEVLSVELEPAREAAHALGGTLNDLYVTGVLGGIGAYHRHFGAEVGELRASVPVSTRSDRSAGGNAFLPARLLLPAGIEDPVARFAAVHERMTAIKGQRLSGLAEAVAGLATNLPPALVLPLFRQQVETVDFSVSNVRGAPVPLFIAGGRILANYPMGPTVGTACNITLLSYCSSMDIGINADAEAVSDVALLRRLIAEGLDELVQAARQSPTAPAG